MDNLSAKIISAIFHPLLVPTYALIILMNFQTYNILAIAPESRLAIVIIVFLTTFVIPSVLIFILLKFGVVSSLQMPNRRERILPMLIVVIVDYGTYHLLKQSSATGLMALFMIGATLLVILALFINYATKISLHMTAWGGLLGTFTGMALIFQFNLSFLIYSIILLCGIIAAARLKLGAHTPLQVYLGFSLGASVMIALLLII